MRYRITGADSTSGRDIEVIIDVADEAEAEREASARGIFVSSINADSARHNGDSTRSPTWTPSRSRLPLVATIAVATALLTIAVVVALFIRNARVQEERRRADEAAAAKRAESEAAKKRYDDKQNAFRATIEPFSREVRGLLGRMDAGLSYNDYSGKVGDLAAAHAGIDRSDTSALNGMIIDAADEAYEAFKDAREPFLNHVKYSKSDYFEKQFNAAFSRAAQKAKLFLVLYEPAKQ